MTMGAAALAPRVEIGMDKQTFTCLCGHSDVALCGRPSTPVDAAASATRARVAKGLATFAAREGRDFVNLGKVGGADRLRSGEHALLGVEQSACAKEVAEANVLQLDWLGARRRAIA